MVQNLPCPQGIPKFYKFLGLQRNSSSLKVKYFFAVKFLKIWTFEGQIDFEIQGHQFRTCLRTLTNQNTV